MSGLTMAESRERTIHSFCGKLKVRRFLPDKDGNYAFEPFDPLIHCSCAPLPEEAPRG